MDHQDTPPSEANQIGSAKHDNRAENQPPTMGAGEGNNEQKAQSKSLLRKTGSALYTLSGVRYMGRNLGYAKQRASFPLLRKVIKDETAFQKTFIDASLIRTELLESTVRYQKILVGFFALLCVWSILLLIKGIIVVTANGDFLNPPLIASIPLITISVMRVLVGLKTIKNAQEELIYRSTSGGKASGK